MEKEPDDVNYAQVDLEELNWAECSYLGFSIRTPPPEFKARPLAIQLTGRFSFSLGFARPLKTPEIFLFKPKEKCQLGRPPVCLQTS